MSIEPLILQKELDAYAQFLQKAQAWVFTITGMEGVGKSELLSQISHYSEQQSLHVFSLDFANDHLCQSRLNVLEELAYQMAPYCSIERFEDFKSCLQRARDNMREVQRSSLSSSQYVKAESHSQISNVDMSILTSQAADKIEKLMYKVEERELASVLSVFYQLLVTIDRTRFILLLDSCECLFAMRTDNLGKWFFDTLIHTLYERLRRRSLQCFVVAASRFKPRMEAIKDLEQAPLTLPLFTAQITYDYLKKYQIHADSYSSIYKLTYGHPLCLMLAMQLYQQPGLPQEHLERRFYQSAWQDLIQKRVLMRQPAPLSTLLTHLPTAEYFDLPTLRSVYSNLLPGQDLRQIYELLKLYPSVIASDELKKLLDDDELKKYSFDEPSGSLTLHPLIQNVIAWNLKRDDAEKWHQYRNSYLKYRRSTSILSTNSSRFRRTWRLMQLWLENIWPRS